MTDVEMARQAVGRWKATAEALARISGPMRSSPTVRRNPPQRFAGPWSGRDFPLKLMWQVSPLAYRRVPQRNRNAGGRTAGGV